MLRLRKKLKNPDSWAREALGIWDEFSKQFSPLNGPLWDAAVDVGPPNDTKPNGLGVDMSHDREISVGACWLEGESAHIEEVWAGLDDSAAVEWIVERAGRTITVVIDPRSPAGSLIPTLKTRRVKVYEVSETGAAMAKACGLVKADLEGGRLTHADQEVLNKAREGARKRAIGTSGGWGYDRKDPSVAIHPLVAVTLARLGAAMKRKPTNGNKPTGRRVVTG